jgi:hypothetical protein
MMKTKKNRITRSVLLIGVLLSLNIGCQKETIIEKPPLMPERYILSLIDPVEPVTSDYFVKIEFPDLELFYAMEDANIKLIPHSSSGFGNIVGRGVSFKNLDSNDDLVVMFYLPETDSAFNFQFAKYRFGNPWDGLSGANIEYYTPTAQPHTYDMYLGTNHSDSYFWITWYDENRICGEFQTELVDCCGGEQSFWVKGAFSIPRLGHMW